MAIDSLLRAFGAKRKRALAAYRRFVDERVDGPSPWLDLKNQVFSGSEQFVECMQAKIDPARPLQEIPRYQRRAVAKPLAYYAAHSPDRDCAIAAAYLTGAYSMQAIWAHFGVSRMTVSRGQTLRKRALSPRCGAVDYCLRANSYLQGVQPCDHQAMLYMYSDPGGISMLALRLPHEIEQRLAELAAKTGRSKSFYAREAILEHLEELEDAYLGAERLETPAKRWSQDELEAGLDLDG